MIPKGFTCQYSIWDVEYSRNPGEYMKVQPKEIRDSYIGHEDTSIKGTISLNDNSCFLLFFDHKPPLVSDDFSMSFNGGLIKAGNIIDVPEIYFREQKMKYVIWNG